MYLNYKRKKSTTEILIGHTVSFFCIVPMAQFCRVIILPRFLTVGGIGYKIRACKQLQVHVYIIELLSSSEASFEYVPLLAM